MTISSDRDSDQVVLLIHGLLRSSKSMYRLAQYMKKHGCEIELYDYPSHAHGIRDHGAVLKDEIIKLMSKYPCKQLSFVTHSLGGIIAREAISLLDFEMQRQCRHLIMLAPPTKGSKWAYFIVKFFPILTSFIKPLSELSSSYEAYVHDVPIPEGIHIGVLAGRYDGKTPPSMTHVAGQSDFMLVNTTHTFIMNHPKTRRAILNFLSYASFQNR